MSDQLMQRWLNDADERAAEALYQTHHQRVFRLAYALLGDAGNAEEVMQDTMVYALTRMKQYDPRRTSFTTWLHTITVSRCRDRKRRKNLPKVEQDDWKERRRSVVKQVSGPEGKAIAHESEWKLWQALNQLSAIVLRYWCGHTYQEMAEILSCPLPTAESRVRGAYEQLRRLLAPALVPALGRENLR
jgi:RNA polymerase sigma factor (sigma-70 family)